VRPGWTLWWPFVAETSQSDAWVARLVGVSKVYGMGTPAAVEVLHQVDLEVPGGDFCALMGPSGSGKSTLLHLLGLLDRPTEGRVDICGVDTRTLDDLALTHLRGHRIGFVFQHHCLLSAFSALENVMMPLLASAGKAHPEMADQAARWLERVGLLPFAHRRVDHLSGGQQQRVALARALVMQPALILADEPTGNLDSRSAAAVFDLLLELNALEGTAVVFVTHNLALAQRCQRLLQVQDGRLAASSSSLAC
jgi:lipoprotein-releasing system ATP-binding protein